jgi:circadian clock protein KaiC
MIEQLEPKSQAAVQLAKTPTGIQGLDEITEGGLPQGRPTLLVGGAGCGKTLLATEFLVNGARHFQEPGVFLAFEENAAELTAIAASLGFDLPDLIDRRLLLLDHVYLERSDIEVAGEFDLEGLFIRLGHAIDVLGARRVVLDTIEAIFSALPNEAILRAELRRLFRWLKAKGVTAVITCERGNATLTRYGLEEYVADCVILLDHRVTEQLSLRRLRVVKYRGSRHSSNEFPFLLGADGMSLLPITSLGLTYQVSTERVSTGVARLDTMLTGGYYRGSTVLVSGMAGTGKTAIAAHFAGASCARGGPCLYMTFEESVNQLLRNMRSLGLDLAPYVEQGLLHIHAARPTFSGLEAHLVALHQTICDLRPRTIILDPVSSLMIMGSAGDVKSMCTRLFDFLKMQQITALLTVLVPGGTLAPETEMDVSSLMDTWLQLKNLESNAETTRTINVVKSRGMAHSQQLREFRLSDRGIEIVDVYVGPAGVLTGTARAEQEAVDRAAARRGSAAERQQQRQREHRHSALQARIMGLQAQCAELELEMQATATEELARAQQVSDDRLEMGRFRGADAESNGPTPASIL